MFIKFMSGKKQVNWLYVWVIETGKKLKIGLRLLPIRRNGCLYWQIWVVSWVNFYIAFWIHVIGDIQDEINWIKSYSWVN